MTTPLPALGIDLAKSTFDVHLLTESDVHSRHLANTPQGFEALAQWLKQLGIEQVHACMEATGIYGDALALFLYQAGHQVSIVNPARIVAFRKSEGGRTKTDKQDAKLIAHFCVQKQPVAWVPTPKEMEQLQVLLMRLEALQQMERQEANRLENSRLDAQTRQEIEELLQDLKTRIQTVKKRLHTHIEQHETLKKPCALLISLPGIAELSAARLLAEIVDIKRFKTVKQLVAHAGIAPEERSSGTSVRGKAFIGRSGRSGLRKTLYMCALVAARHDPAMRAWVKPLRQRGKPAKVVLTAVMRKLLHMVYGILKSETPYDPTKAFPGVALASIPEEEVAA
jgi:transposase